MKRIMIKKPADSIGGPTTFMNNLIKELERNEFPFTYNKLFPKAYFFPISASIRDIKRIKAAGGRIIQRLDGIYYPEKHGERYVELNRDIKKIYQEYADVVIFQSKYSKEQCFNMFGEKAPGSYELIINGADNGMFYPSAEKRKANIIKYVTTGNFRNRDMLIPLIKALDIVREQQENIELKIVGPVTIPEREDLLSKDYVNYYGEKSAGEIAEILRDSDIFLYSHLNPPCPNSVVEAVSCGLPVVGFNSGAMSELCFFNRELLADVPQRIFHRYEDLDFRELADKIILCTDRFDEFKRNSIDNQNSLSMKKCALKYIDVFEKTLKNKRGKINLSELFKILVKKR